MKSYLVSALAAALIIMDFSGQAQSPAPATSTEKYRPAFHFTPRKNWINDPNGLVYYDGEYHLFYQYNPQGNRWGHMSWGHAVSKDLLHWNELPVALNEFANPDGKSVTMIFSGSAVIDYGNTSKLCPTGTKDCMVAIYTSHVDEKGKALAQHQSLAYSTDKGRTWQQYAKNPVLELNTNEFRDPNVFWYEPQKKWIMAAVKPDEYSVLFFESKDLKSWKQMSRFGKQGDQSKIWECPSLIQVPILNEPGKSRWVLFISSGHRQEGYVGMQYFVGDFDGTNFKLDQENPKPASAEWGNVVDYGKDYYAAIPYNNLPASQKRPVMMGWINNWEYANDLPTEPFKGAMSLPREIALKRTPEGLTLIQQPKISGLRNQVRFQQKSLSLNNTSQVVSEVTSSPFELEVTLVPGQAESQGIRLYKDGSEETVLFYQNGKIQLDRRKSGNVSFHQRFPSVEEAPGTLQNGAIKLRLIADASVLEVYVNDGEAVLTDLVFPEKTTGQMELFTKGGTGEFKDLKISSLTAK
ncbi:glycoside hydrolase family 32 protein [Siphonobacter sp.]|uniref:glycoside hydrolase family 32 protein n=1 Tax=Siphonobacter sp. TaxID=1869184 RepID=UPI003B3A5D33